MNRYDSCLGIKLDEEKLLKDVEYNLKIEGKDKPKKDKNIWKSLVYRYW